MNQESRIKNHGKKFSATQHEDAINSATPYKIGDGGYNRQSGKKTLMFVAVIILLIVILSLSTLYLLNASHPIPLQSNK